MLDALAESPAIHRALADLERAGLELRLALECRETALARRAAALAVPAVAPRERADDDAGFRIDGEDLRFLRAIGIDPTRSRRSRRRS